MVALKAGMMNEKRSFHHPLFIIAEIRIFKMIFNPSVHEREKMIRAVFMSTYKRIILKILIVAIRIERMNERWNGGAQDECFSFIIRVMSDDREERTK